MWSCDSNVTSTILAANQAAGPLFVQTLQTFMAAQCALIGDQVWPADATEHVLEDPNYDFIVIGAGSAGSVVANRLSEISTWKVLLVEAGGDPTLESQIPLLFYSNLKTPIDWAYTNEPGEACRSYKTGGCAWPRGKTLGGSSAINGLYYVRGNKLDYDEWASNGNNGWSYDEVLPYFKKSEKLNRPMTKVSSKYHGFNGYLDIDDANEIYDYEQVILRAANELGIKTLDFNGVDQMGIMRTFTTVKGGVRESTATAFLNPIKNRTNLHVMKNTYATKILFEGNTNTVTGVLLEKDGKTITVNIKKELILSAGAINTPQLMMLSGLGPRKHLEELQIDVRADLPVGENLQDHLFVPIYYSVPSDKTAFSLPNITSMFLDFVINHKGLLSDTSPSRMIDFMNTTDPLASTPDIQHHYLLIPPSLYNMLNIYEKHGFSDEFVKKFNKVNTDLYIFQVCTVLLQPKSKGRIILKSKDPNEYPLIYANYFEAPDDMATVIRALRKHALRLGSTKSFKDAKLKLQWIEPKACENLNKESDQFLECISRELTFSLYHPTSTAKMGKDTDPTAVVNPELKVKKVERLRVIDASIMPNIVRGNTNAPTIMIGEKGADLIKSEWLSKINVCKS